MHFDDESASEKSGRREECRRHTASPSPRRPIVVPSTTEYKYGEIGEITGKVGENFSGSVFSGLRGLGSLRRVDRRAASSFWLLACRGRGLHGGEATPALVGRRKKTGIQSMLPAEYQS
jgi:hypothetical protein